MRESKSGNSWRSGMGKTHTVIVSSGAEFGNKNATLIGGAGMKLCF